MKDEVWMALGALASGGDVVILTFHHGSESAAREGMKKVADEHFGAKATEAVCEVFNIVGRPSKVRRQISDYFLKIGIPRHEINEQLRQFSNQFLEQAKYRH